ncbi:hypothetical protein MVEN_01872100 [Mycena venus]|uniref:Uncharacterized protein n=1 Tax=Mycena venus TaxID=2733690 RepID=A0A8H6XIX6_9AGAR|nr:hypothetical protein MVEN_01872100 [Mycena venus]
MIHYRPNIEKFGAPRGACSSIAESRHLTAFKKPWRRLDKLSAPYANFLERGMVLPNLTAVPDKIVEDADVEEADEHLADYIKVPDFPDLLLNFLHDQLSSPNYQTYSDVSDDDLDIPKLPISVYHSAVATFYAPSDPSGICGMRREHIRSTPTWRKHGPRRDCVFVVENQGELGFRA